MAQERSNHRRGASARDTSGPSPAATSAAEWIGAGVGLLVLLFVVGALLLGALADDGAPPLVEVEAGEITEFDHGFHVAFSTTNEGDGTAAGLSVVGELLGSEGVVERSETVVDFVPPGSTRRGGLYFTRNPDDYRLQLRAAGYEAP